MTVSRALRGNQGVDAELRMRIERVAAGLGWKPDPEQARLLSHLRARRAPRYVANLAFFSLVGREQFEDLMVEKLQLQGVRERALELGYGIEFMSIGDPRVLSGRLTGVLEARGVRGIIVHQSCFPHPHPDLVPVLEAFPCVCLGVRPRGVPMQAVAPDPARLLPEVFEEVMRRGFHRPGLCCEFYYDMMLDSTISATFAHLQKVLPVSARVPLLVAEGVEGRIRGWWEMNGPDVVITGLYDVFDRDPVLATVPRVSLDWTPAYPDWAGIDNQHDALGRAAVEQLVEQINQPPGRRRLGYKRLTVESRWRPGPSLMRKRRHSRFWHPTWATPHEGLSSRRRFICLDLSRHLNETFADSTGSRWAANPEPLDCRAYRIHGVPFQIAGRTRLGRGGAALVSYRAPGPGEWIAIQRQAKTVFLLAAAVDVSDVRGHEHLGDLVFQREDGVMTRFPVVARAFGSMTRDDGALMQDWWQPAQRFLVTGDSLPAWIGRWFDEALLGRVVYSIQWTNPWPKRHLQAMTFERDAGAVGTFKLIAVTVA